MQKRNIQGLVIAAIGLLLIFSLCWLGGRSHASTRQQEKPQKPAAVEQKWKVVADVAPKDLQDELLKLNKDGYTIDQSNIVAVGDKFTIILGDDNISADEEEESEM